MGGRGTSSGGKQSKDAFIKDIVENYDGFTRGDLQGVVEAYAAANKLDDEELLREIDRKAAQRGETRIDRNEIDAVYNYVEKRGGRYPTIGQNTKAYKYAINNATDIQVHDDDNYNYLQRGFYEKATREDMKRAINTFDMKLNYVGDNTFRLRYYSGYYFTFTLKK